MNSGTDDIFSGGQSKDINDLNQWMVGQGSPQDKADIADAFAVAYEVPVAGTTHTVLNFGAHSVWITRPTDGPVVLLNRLRFVRLLVNHQPGFDSIRGEPVSVPNASRAR